MSNADNTGFFVYDSGNAWPYGRGAPSESAALTLQEAPDHGSPGGLAAQTPTKLPTPQSAAIPGHYLFDFYYRIWVFPSVMTVNNPTLNVNIPFAIWNAYPYPPTNTLESVTVTGSGGLSFDTTPPSVFQSLEYRTVNLQVTGSAPLVISTNFKFNFDLGFSDLLFQSIRSVVLSVVPEVPVTEEWVWHTDVMVSYNGTEQRVALRPTPRRSVKFDLGLNGDDDYRTHFRALWGNIASQAVIPFFQYSTTATVRASSGDTTIYLDPARTDLRLDEDVFMVAPGGTSLAKVTGIFSDHITIDAPLPMDMPKELSLVVPCASAFVANKTALSQGSWEDGILTIQADVVTIRDTLSRPGSATSFSTLNGLTILDKLPTVTDKVDTTFDGGAEIIDYDPAVLKLISSWLSVRLQFNRTYLVQRIFSPTDMDYWRDFLQSTMGQQGLFLLPTFRPDLELLVTPTRASNQIKIKSNFYSGSLFSEGFGSFENLMLVTSSGVLYTNVTSAVNNGDGTDTLDISPHLPDAVGWNIISKISLLVRCRLGADKVTLTHSGLATLIDLVIRSA